MPSFRSNRRVAHSPEEMFALVADVEKYPQFLPFCTGLVLRERRVGADGNEVIVATMSVGYGAIAESFTSRVTLQRQQMRIVVDYIDGPFKHLHNIWDFRSEESSDQGCTITFFIDYEFKNRLLGILMGAMFDKAFRRFVTAFEARAKEVYGP